MRGVVLGFLIGVSSLAADFRSVEQAFKNFQAEMFRVHPADPSKLEPLANAVSGEVFKLLADQSTPSDPVSAALEMQLKVDKWLAEIDPSSSNTAKLNRTVARIRHRFPGSALAALADGLAIYAVLQTATQDEFAAALKVYAADYPALENGPTLAVAYSKLEKYKSRALGEQAIQNALKLFPNHPLLLRQMEALAFLGRPAKLQGTTLDGEAFDITDWKGHVCVIDVWSTNCKPCCNQTESFNALHDELSSKGLKIIGVSFDSVRPHLEQYRAEKKLRCSQLFFENSAQRGEVSSELQVNGIPWLVVVDKNGNYAAYGTHHFNTMREIVDRLLKE